MRFFGAVTLLIGVGGLVTACGKSADRAASAEVSQSTERRLPNVVIFYADDLGYGDVGAYGATAVPTPNIDKLAADGVRFTDAHATAATCTP